MACIGYSCPFIDFDEFCTGITNENSDFHICKTNKGEAQLHIFPVHHKHGHDAGFGRKHLARLNLGQDQGVVQALSEMSVQCSLRFKGDFVYHNKCAGWDG